MQNALVNVNGQITGFEQAKVSVFDRSYLYGDSLYEVIRTYGGRFFGMDEHLARLESSAKLCRMVLAQPLDVYRAEMQKTLDRFLSQPGRRGTGTEEAYCRLIVSRGVGRIGFGLGCLTTPTQYTIIVQPLEVPPAEQYENGVRMRVVSRLRNDPRALDPAMKSGNYLNSLLAYLEATAADAYDALLCNAEGHVTEGTTFNVFYARNGIVCTSPLDIGILDGLTRRHVIRIAGELGIDVRVTRFPKERLYEADEVFLTSTIKEVFPITRVDDRTIGNGKAGPITRALGKAFSEWAGQQALGGSQPAARAAATSRGGQARSLR